MRWKTLLPLFFVFIAFLFFGAWIFKTLEETYHVPGIRIEHDLEAVIVAIARRVNSSVSEDEVLAYIEAARTGRFPMSQNGTTTAYHMDYFDAWFFCITFITTIGYGFITPHTVGGKLFCIVYAFLGIPVTLIMLTAIGRKLGDTNRWVEKKVQKKLPNYPGRIRAVTLLIVVVTSVGIFFFVPAIIFTIVEGWNFLDSLYYCFITLSTVGFGDFVSSVHHESSSYFGFVLYKVILFLWIMVGLSIVAAVFDLIQEALRGLKTRVNRNMKDLSVDHFGHLVSRVHEEGGKGLGKITDITKSKMKKQRARTSISRKNKNPDEETASDGMPGSYVAQEW
ncbi:PREDICTED: potassium channel subfamily K member 2-like [Branchiostoma belcheri]|uniref:Potassium channel subfamily K member 2-like n=1 Tax=Branchiostoma belcheri TaxID=7741 RepID=A0A6P5AG19_BRABE|nr:PREDICTED: potassium channel subfamily K member 2-like [Branchiostoma belcheri]